MPPGLEFKPGGNIGARHPPYLGESPHHSPAKGWGLPERHVYLDGMEALQTFGLLLKLLLKLLSKSLSDHWTLHLPDFQVRRNVQFQHCPNHIGLLFILEHFFIDQLKKGGSTKRRIVFKFNFFFLPAIMSVGSVVVRRVALHVS